MKSYSVALVVVLALVVLAVIVTLLVSAAADDGAREREESPGEPEIEVPVERGVPGSDDEAEP